MFTHTDVYELKEQLEQLSSENLGALKKLYGINESGNDLLWLLALQIHTGTPADASHPLAHMLGGDGDLIAEQDFEFAQGLKADKRAEYKRRLEELLGEREAVRQQVQAQLRKLLPAFIEESFTPAEQRLLRTPEYLLDESEKTTRKALDQRLNKCYGIIGTGRANWVMELAIPGIPYKICVDVLYALQSGMVNADVYNNKELSDMGFADVIISIPESKVAIRYPLSPDEFNELLAVTVENGKFPDEYKRMPIPQLTGVGI